MKQGMSSLNPNAALYVPLRKQETAEDSLKNVGKTTGSNFLPNGPIGVDRSYLQADADYDIPDLNGLLIGNDFTKKGVQNLSELTKKHSIDEDSEMDLAYLAIMFPNMSEQSLADVYSVNGDDVEASVDMLNELECDPVDFSEHLPSRLDIGDVSECKVTESSSMNPKRIFSGEASGSAVGPSDSGF